MQPCHAWSTGGRLSLLLLLVGLTSGVLAPLAAGLAAPAALAAPSQQTSRTIHVAEIDGPITPVTAQYLRRVQRLSEQGGATALLLRLDTPGGLDGAMRQMAQDLLGATIPTIVYVAPPGARAASAGMFVALAAHVAAMAPGTNIGAAHPVALGQGGDTADSTPLTKATEDAAALARSLASRYGRNAEWAERAVRESVAITASEAAERQVIDVIAADIPDLLRQLDGHALLVAGQRVTLQTSDASIRVVPMTWLEQLLAVVANPNVALILISLGTLGLMAELSHPGTVLPGVFGAAALILGFVGLGNLPFNWAGLVLLGLAVGLLIAEVLTAGFGAFGVGAVIAFVLGAVLLFVPLSPPSAIQMRVAVHPMVIASMATTLAAFVFLVLRSILRARESPISVGVEQLIGTSGIALDDLGPGTVGRVRVAHEDWSAEVTPRSSPSNIPTGTPVEVVEVSGVTLLVRPRPAPAAGPATPLPQQEATRR